jgi:ABC-type transport system involved in multi-copper enzyme maturation permease subunit
MAGCALILGNDFAYDVEHPDEQAVRDTLATTMAIGDPVVPSTQLAQFAVVALAMLMITAEYSTGTIRATLRAQPARGRVLLTKVVVASGVAFVAGLVLGAAGLVGARIGLGEYAVVNTGDTAGIVVRVATYLALVTVISVGMGAALRSAVGTLSAVLVLLVGLSMVVSGPLADYLPGVAGAKFIQDGNVADGLLVTAWASAVLATGYAVLRGRDA